MHFRNDLECTAISSFMYFDSWSSYMKRIKEEVPENEDKLFLLLTSGWVYEGRKDEMFKVLEETDPVDFLFCFSKIQMVYCSKPYR